MYRFALRPWWILSHIVVVAIAILFINLGIWQLHRHDERVAQNEAVVARTAAPVVPISDLLGTAVPDDLRYRPVTATGTFMTGADLFVDNRSYQGHPGAWVVTPLVLDDGSTVAVSRGFVSSSVAVAPAAPQGLVTVSGTVIEFDGGCGTRTGESDAVIGAACLSRDAMETVAGGELVDLAIQRIASEPVDSPDLIPVPLPELDDGPHRSYAGQWFLFTAVGVVTYPFILRRAARHRSIEPADAPTGEA